jgi:multiple sugar transport system ATP-binding protein
LEDISSGQIFLGDRQINHLEPGDRDIAMVFQNYALYPHMSVKENMSFGLRMRRTPKAEIEKRVQEVAQILALEPLLNRRPKELSGGQRQRVAVGRAIVRQPQAFLFDEPLSNLDAKLRVQMRTELARLHQRLKTTTVYVTHDQVEAMTLGDRIVVMKDGRIQQIDSPMNVYQFPTNKFVAGFIGSPAMNFVDGQIDQGVFHANGIRLPLTGKNIEAKTAPQNGPAVLGFRPESLTTSDTDPLLAKVRLEVVEQMGYESVVYFSVGGFPMVAKLNGQATVRPGDEVSLHLPLGQWHLFSASENEFKQQVRL